MREPASDRQRAVPGAKGHPAPAAPRPALPRPALWPAQLQVTPEPRPSPEGWPPYSASFRPHEVAVRRMVGHFSDDWWARAQVGG